jgi:putative transcriptional regulator
MKGGMDYEKMSLAEQLREGLKESIAHSRGRLTLKTTTLAAPAPRLTRARVIAIRKKTGMSQAVFASFLNVPKRTLQSWEQGARSPKAGEARLLQIVEISPARFESLILSVAEARSGSRARRSRAVA